MGHGAWDMGHGTWGWGLGLGLGLGASRYDSRLPDVPRETPRRD